MVIRWWRHKIKFSIIHLSNSVKVDSAVNHGVLTLYQINNNKRKIIRKMQPGHTYTSLIRTALNDQSYDDPSIFIYREEKCI